jgi:hypothetical protein
VGIDGLAGAHVSIVGFDGSDTPLTVEADSVRAYKVYVSVPPALRQQLSSSTNLKVSVTNVESGDTVITDTTFRSSGQ